MDLFETGNQAGLTNKIYGLIYTVFVETKTISTLIFRTRQATRHKT